MDEEIKKAADDIIKSMRDSDNKLANDIKNRHSYHAIRSAFRLLVEQGVLGVKEKKAPDGRVIEENHFLTHKGYQYESYHKLTQDERANAELTAKKLKIDVKNAERIFKTYWITFALSLAAFLISLALLILKIREGQG